ncbi:MAG: hypothetical protein RSA84_11175 [Acinetobacter sp.]
MKAGYTMKRIWAGILAGGLMFPWLVEAEDTATVTIPFTIVNPMPTCDLTFDGKPTLTYVLGTMSPGTDMRHMPFTVSVNCHGKQIINTALTARNINGTLQSGDDSVKMRVNDRDEPDGPVFWLTGPDDQRVKLTGREGDAFCAKNKTSAGTPNTCQLSPFTSIPAQSPQGLINVTIRFDIIYT